MEVLKKSAFWKKFLKYLSIGLSCMVILYFFQAQPGKILAAVTCTTQPAATTIISPVNNQTLPTGTSSVNVSWSGVNADDYVVTATNNTGGPMPTYPSTVSNPNILVSGLQNDNSYTVLVVPRNSCGSGSGSQVSFTIAAMQTSCLNQGQCLACGGGGDDDGGYSVCPTTENNCSPTCQDGIPGQFTCSITQQPQGGNYYSLIVSPSNLPYQNYLWDLDGNFSYETTNMGPTISSRPFQSNTTVHLQARDTDNNLWACSTTINPASSTGNSPICTISAYPSNNISAGTTVTFTGNGTAYNGKYINSYQWDFDNNGVYDTSTNTSNRANFTFNSPQMVRLHVTDSGSLGGDCTTWINVGNQYPIGSCVTDRISCPDGSTVGRNPNNACNFYICSNTGGSNQCRSIYCPAIVPNPGCYYTVQPLQYTCNPNTQLTCGEWTCPIANQPTPITNPITFPSPFEGMNQNTWVGVSNTNSNINANLNFSDSFSDSWASGGSGGSSNVTINW